MAWRRINRDALVSGRKLDRDACEDQLHMRLPGLISELGQTLCDLDPRWLTFGFKRSSVPTHKINNRQSGIGNAEDLSPHADYYQVWIQFLVVDADSRLADSPKTTLRT